MSACQFRVVGLLGFLLGMGGGCIEAVKYTPLIPPPPTAPVARLPQNNSYQGSIHSTLPDSLRPRFTWTAAATDEDDPIVYELELSTTRDFTGEIITIETQETEARPVDALPVSKSAPVGNRYYWRARACLPLVCSEYSAVRWLNVGRSDHDFNGDGYADVVVGAPTHDGTGQDAGAAFVYFGGPGNTFNTTADGTLYSAVAGNNFGDAVASAGDFDGDGYADIVVGAPLQYTRGAVSLYFGGFGPTFDPTADLIFTESQDSYYGKSVSSAGDFNGDGFSDFVVGAPGDIVTSGKGSAYVYFGNAEGSRRPGMRIPGGASDHAGENVATLGDIDNDGLSDLAIGDGSIFLNGMYNCNSYLYLGREAFTPNASPSDTLSFERTGCKIVTGSGDFNGDGFSDVLYGAGDASYGSFSFGSARLLPGSERRGFAVRSLFIADDAMAVAGIGDLNHDSFDDFMVSKGAGDTVGIYLGSAMLASPLNPAVSLTGTTPRSHSIAGIGDVNGDGIADIAIGDYRFSSNRGMVEIFLGVAKGSLPFNPDPVGVLDVGAAESLFGWSVAAIDSRRRLSVERCWLAMR